MLVPAITKKAELEEKFAQYLYAEDMFFYTGYPHARVIPEISADSEERFQWAIVDQGKVVGYLDYRVSLYNDSAYNFGLYSFDKGNIVVGRDLKEKIEQLVNKYHRVEWRMVGGNPVQRSYDRFCEKHGGRKIVLHDVCKDENGVYHDDIIYEIVRGV